MNSMNNLLDGLPNQYICIHYTLKPNESVAWFIMDLYTLYVNLRWEMLPIYNYRGEIQTCKVYIKYNPVIYSFAQIIEMYNGARASFVAHPSVEREFKAAAKQTPKYAYD